MCARFRITHDVEGGPNEIWTSCSSSANIDRQIPSRVFFRTLHHCQISPGTEWKSVLFSSRPISTMSIIHPRSLADCGRLVGLTENVSTPSNSEGYPPTMSRRSHFPAVILDYWNAIRCSLLDCDFNVFGTITFRLVQGGRFPIWWDHVHICIGYNHVSSWFAPEIGLYVPKCARL